MHLVHSISLKNVSLLFSFSLSLPVSLSGCTRQQGLTQLSTASTVPDLFAPIVYIYIDSYCVLVVLCSSVDRAEAKDTVVLSVLLRSFSESWPSLVLGASVGADLYWIFFPYETDETLPVQHEQMFGASFSVILCALNDHWNDSVNIISMVFTPLYDGCIELFQWMKNADTEGTKNA